MRRSNARIAKPNLDDGSAGMDPVKLQFRSSRAGFRSPNSRFAKTRSRFCFYISISIPFVLFFYIFFFRGRGQVSKRYSVVIDGGSTGTRVHVFEYLIRDGKLVLDFSERGSVSLRMIPGLSAYADNPERSGAVVAELVEFARKNVPRNQWQETEARLMATAGMRLLKNDDQERILNACRNVLRLSGFIFQDDWATVISGSDEGVYGWVVANYALGTLGAEPSQTSGIIELGGASAQVTFVPNEPIPPAFSQKVKFGNFTYDLYSHSLLHFGQNVAFESLQDSLVSAGQKFVTESLRSGKLVDPCTPRGYSSSTVKVRYVSVLEPSGNFSECRSASVKLLQKGKDKCLYATCYIGSTFIPKLRGTFLATENFFHTSKFFGLGERFLLSDLVVAGQQFCSEEWSKLARKYTTIDEEDLLHYCFSSAYIVALLHDSLGIALNDQRIRYVNRVENIPLDWAVGAFILQTASRHPEAESSAPWYKSSTGLLLLGASAFTAASWLGLKKWRRPQLKTIYDLEKGKYIVTHI
ncbi:hypothetical protein M569_07539, partial [Genlisea aurea]